ncbi:MAG: ParB/RepB/Spo0J family partition protein [Bacilli bacterium]|nr:ParB/RepB/Spo0J family partition protein [Bacilli bacterium]
MGNTITYIPIAELIPSEFHAHLEFQNDNIDNLANSIKQLGILEPLIVRKKDDKYEIIIGNRRYNAAKSIGMDKVPVIVENITDEQAINMIITNNVQRKELTGKEEASLYDKAISYPNTNVEKLSITLGIPIDRIYSKLKLIKKHNNNSNQILKNSLNNETEVNNNLINNDIINLSELDKNEIRRERIEMNENQSMDNNINNGLEQNLGQGMNTEPAFGGRFFPSMEESNNIVNGLNQQIPNQDLNNIQPNINVEPAPIPNFSEPTPETNIPAFNNANPIPSPEANIPTFNNVDPTPSPEVNIPTFNNTDQTSSTSVEQSNYNEVPSMTNPLSFQNNYQEQTTIESGLNNMEVPNEVPSINPNINVENPIPTNETLNPEFDLNSIPNLNNTESKDITPIINMIKSITTNMELLGYKINVTENEEATSYKINIEVEK